MLELAAISVQYGKRPVLRDVSLSVGAGEIVALVGANAAGKTTTLRTIMGLKEPAAGAIHFNGEDATRLSTVERVRRGLALSPEGRQIFPKFSVQENLLMGGYHRADRNHLDGDIARVCDMFPRLAERRSQRAGWMSGGEQQMLAIGRALISRPRCLLLDEPTLGLAPIIVEEIGTHRASTCQRRHDDSARRAKCRHGTGRRQSRLCIKVGPHLARREGGGAQGNCGGTQALPRRLTILLRVDLPAVLVYL